jgi:hypothetical protein
MSEAAYNGSGLRASSTVTPAGGSAVNETYVWDTLAPIDRLIMDSTNAYNLFLRNCARRTGKPCYRSRHVFGSRRSGIHPRNRE